MLKMCTRMAAAHTMQIALTTPGNASITVYSDIVTDPTTLLNPATPATGKLITFLACTLNINADGFIKISNLSAAAQAALATASGTAKWWRLTYGYAHIADAGGTASSPGIYVGEVGNVMGQHALMLTGGNVVTQGQPKPIQSFALRIKQ